MLPSPNMYRSKHLFLSTVLPAILLLTLAGSVTLAVIPHLFQNLRTPSLGVFAASGLAMVLLTAGLFWWLNNKLNLGFKRSALVLGLSYNLLIVGIKFLLAPYGLYRANASSSFDATFGDPNSPLFYLMAGAIILLLYVLAFKIIYSVSRRRVERALTLPKSAKKHRTKSIVIVALTLALATVLTGGAILLLALLFLGLPLSYINLLWGSVGPELFVAIIAAIWLASIGFGEVEKQAIATKNASLLASFFWLGVCLILAYHIMWIVFMITLVQIWPFNTYTPK